MHTPLSIAILGAGGHARVVADLIRISGATLLGCYARDSRESPSSGLTVLGDDEELLACDRTDFLLTMGVGSPPSLRRLLFQKFSSAGFHFSTLRHPGSIVSPDTEIAEGVQCMAGSVVQAGTRIEDNVIINTRSSVDHDCRIGAHTHIAPGAVLCGGVLVGEGAQIGAGAIVLPHLKIGANGVVGAGAVVTRHVPEGSIVKGVPAR